MAIELRLREQLVNSANRINTRSKYYGNANPVPVVALRMIYELIAIHDSGYINLNFKCLHKLELLANDIVIKNKDICKLRGPSVFYQDRQDNIRILTTAHLGPIVESNSKYIPDGVDTIKFNYNDFTRNFSENAKSVKIMTLPAYGKLELNGVAVQTKDIIDLDDIEGMVYTRIDNNYQDPFYFKTSNNETEKTFSNMATFTVNVDGQINSAPTVDNNSATDAYGVTRPFTRADFTLNYYDADGDAVENLRITSLPSAGEIQYNGVAINVNDEFNFTNDIDAEKLTYVPNNAITDAQVLDFTFQVSDTYGNWSS
jgi:hypothetical protein